LPVGITHEINQPLTAIATAHLHTAGVIWNKPNRQAQNSLDKFRPIIKQKSLVSPSTLKRLQRVAALNHTSLFRNVSFSKDAIRVCMSNQIQEQQLYAQLSTTDSKIFRSCRNPIRLKNKSW